MFAFSPIQSFQIKFQPRSPLLSASSALVPSLPWQLNSLAVGEASSPHPGQMLTSSSPGSSTGALQIPSQRTRGCVPNWVAPLKEKARSSALLAPTGSPGIREPPSSGEPRESRVPETPAPLPGGRHRQSSHLSLQPGVADAREGRGPEAGTGTPELRESASWDALPPLGLANSQPLLGAAPTRGNRASLHAPRSPARPKPGR